MTEKVVEGEDVPTPVRPESRTVNNEVEAMSDTMKAADEVEPLAQTVRRAGEVVVPTEKKPRPPVSSKERKLAESTVVEFE